MVVEYAYDAYGNSKIVSCTNTNLGNYNPIRYRGYYLDRETGLYYLNARYYNPQWRRFISHDDAAYLDPDTINGLNLYAYTANKFYYVGVAQNTTLITTYYTKTLTKTAMALLGLI